MSLPKILKPVKKFLLSRFGRNNDGGYLVSKKTVCDAKTLISFGIADDISFEKDFLQSNDIKTLCFDKSVNKTFWIRKFYIDLGGAIYNLNFKYFIKSLKNYFEFKKFLKSKRVKFFVKEINQESIKQIFSTHEIISPIFFKIDIEGSEYRILDDILKIQEKICGLVIEFHDIDLHLDKIKNFIDKFNLHLTHIHANNFGQLDKHGDPTVIELTFEKNPEHIDGPIIFPNNYDQSNNPEGDDIELTFK